MTSSPYCQSPSLGDITKSKPASRLSSSAPRTATNSAQTPALAVPIERDQFLNYTYELDACAGVGISIITGCWVAPPPQYPLSTDIQKGPEEQDTHC